MNSSADYKNHMSCILRKGALWNRESKKINVLHVLLHNSAIVTCTYDPGQHFWDKFPPFPPPPITMLIFHGLWNQDQHSTLSGRKVGVKKAAKEEQVLLIHV